MKKAELIDAVAGDTGATKAMAKNVIDNMLEHIKVALTEQEDVVLPGFGTFATNDRAARTGRNPSTGEPIQIKASTGVKFKPSSALKEAVNS